MNFEASKTERGFDAIHPNGFVHRKHRNLKKNGTYSWLCVHANSKKCKDKGTLVEASFTLTFNHSQFSDPDECVQRDFAASIKLKTKDTSEKPQKIVRDSPENLPPIAAPILPDY